MNARNLLLFSVSALTVSSASSVDFKKHGSALFADLPLGAPILYADIAKSDEAILDEIPILDRKDDLQPFLAKQTQKIAANVPSPSVAKEIELFASSSRAITAIIPAAGSDVISNPDVETHLEFSSETLEVIDHLSRMEQGDGTLVPVVARMPASSSAGTDTNVASMIESPIVDAELATRQFERAVFSDDKITFAAVTPVVAEPVVHVEPTVAKLAVPDGFAQVSFVTDSYHQPAAITASLPQEDKQSTLAMTAVESIQTKVDYSSAPQTQALVNVESLAAPLVELADAPQYVFYANADIEPGATQKEVPAAAIALPLNAIVTAGASVAALTAAAADVPAVSAAYDGTVSMEQAIAAAMETNPEINQAIMNKEAIEFEREQAQGLFLPRVDLEASAGIRRLENGTRRALGIDRDLLYPVEGMITAEQTLIDFGRRNGELRRQAARTDGAALRVVERSENVALLISRQYLNILLQQRVSAAAEDNVTFHRMLVSDLGQGVAQGSISIADQQQAQERLQAAIVRQAEAQEDLKDAQITLQTLTGLQVENAAMPKSLRLAAPPTLGEAVSLARQNNPKVKEAQADVDAAHAMADKAKGDFAPTIGLEARGRAGHDIDGFAGRTNDLQGRIVMRWNIFDGGINRAKYQEMVRRASETRFRLHELVRLAEEDVQRAWNSMSTQGKVAQELEIQSRVSDDLLLSYRQQFNVGRRSLLDVLDAQNTRYNVQVRLETARFSEQFAEYQVLASTNTLLESLGLNAPAAGESKARERFSYGPPAPAELQRRRYPR